MTRKTRRPRPIPEIEIVDRPRPAPADLDLSAHWYLVWTSPRAEARAAKALSAAGCQVFWPAIERVVRRRDKPPRDYVVATYPRYLFAAGLPSLARRMTIVGPDGRTGITIDGRPITDMRQIDGVVGVVAQGERWCQVPRAAIEQCIAIQGRLDGPAGRPEARRAPVAQGQPVVIANGPFAGFQATVVEAIGLDAARVLISVFGRPTLAEFELAQLAAA